MQNPPILGKMPLDLIFKMPKNESNEPKKKAIYTVTLTDEQMEKLKSWCDRQLWGFYEVEYARFAFKGPKVNVVGYKSGKLVIQGKGTEEFIQFVLEPKITKDVKFGYDEFLNPQYYEPHAGLDESGKGDLFGPLVTACVIADKPMVQAWLKAGLQDSKKITSDQAILKLEKIIRNTQGVVVKTMLLGMTKYNELYKRFGNLNKLMAWMHCKGLEDALKVRRVEWGMLDQFSKAPLVQRIFKDKTFNLKMQTKAEADPVVAAASVIARAEFVRQLTILSKEFGEPLKKGASSMVKAQAKEIVTKLGADALPKFAKMHFKTAYEVLGLPVPESTFKKRNNL